MLKALKVCKRSGFWDAKQRGDTGPCLDTENGFG